MSIIAQRLRIMQKKERSVNSVKENALMKYVVMSVAVEEDLFMILDYVNFIFIKNN